MTARQASRFIAATWLIGLGLVFLVRQALNLEWAEAWPLFVILVGLVGVVSTLLRPGRAGRGLAALWTLTWPLVWTAVGLILLASTTGALSAGPLEIVETWWPWAAIVLGAWFIVGALVPLRAAPTEELARPLGTLAEAAVRIRFGAGELGIHAASADHLVDGTFRGGVVVHDAGSGSIELEQDVESGLPWLDHDATWNVGLTSRIPLDLRLDTGACRSVLDLTELRIRTLELHTGASQTKVRLPRTAGATSVRAETGAADVTIEVPSGVAARVHGQVAIGALTVDDQRFPKGIDGAWTSPDFATAANRVDVDIRSGLGAVRVVSVPEAAAA
jgi:hypothetical protein